MSNKNGSSSSSSGIGFFGLLAIVFITLKLIGVISWSWWVVLLPLYFWVPLLIIGVLIWFILHRRKERRRVKRLAELHDKRNKGTLEMSDILKAYDEE